MAYDIRNDQQHLGYIYETAKYRLEDYPDKIKECEERLQKYPFVFTNKKDALEYAIEIHKTNPFGKIMVKIEKSEEFYHFANYWIVTDDGAILQAAEFIGMADFGIGQAQDLLNCADY